MGEKSEQVKNHIELAIDSARHGVSDGIDEIDRRLRSTMDVKQQARDHAGALMIAGGALGLLLGLGGGKVLVRTIQLAAPIVVVRLLKSRLEGRG
ncbi:MAG TPA: hypothetical protein VMT00_01735 [Thermoanaerobaculia bacterium]|nr:hypothetical protein [Thermoanaerobaculia bacterium]